jgi:hypothetical protein
MNEVLNPGDGEVSARSATRAMGSGSDLAVAWVEEAKGE